MRRLKSEIVVVLIQAYAQAGSAGRDVFVLQKLLPLLGKISGAERPLPIARLSVLPSVQAPGAQLARQALGASEQLKAAAGVDLAELTRRLSERLGPG